ncbi:MAG: hypothetical protein RLZZ450_5018 [Pseudomonadota bacterium]|jgi:hypothetical protein
MGGGRIGVQVEGYKNGALCGRTVWNNSTSTTATFSWRYTPCADGQHGTYQTRVKGHVYLGNSAWAERGQQFSPNLGL